LSSLPISYLVEESRRFQSFQLLQELVRICPEYYQVPVVKK